MRKMVTVRTVNKIEPIEGADLIELAHVDGWQCVTKRGEFNVGDKGFYFEIDSVVPTNDARFAFLDNKAKHQILVDDKFNRVEFRGAKIKTMKLKGVLSQGLLLPLSSINTKGKAVDPSKFKWMYDFSRHVSQEDFIDTMTALDCPSHVVDVYLSNETGEPKFVVEIPGTGIWLNAFGSETEATEFCKLMEWKYNVCPLLDGMF